MNKPYLVYMWNTCKVDLSSAHRWMKENGKTESDFKGIISEHVFFCFLDGRLGNTPCIFVTK